MLRMLQWIGWLAMAGAASGCAHMYDVTDDYMMDWKCCHDAKMAWLHVRDLYAEVCYPFDFGQGFRAGYKDVCMGSEGCHPPMPPRQYWSHHYQCDEGKCKIMAWYDGYHHGVLAAHCDGCDGRCRVFCANDVYGERPCEVDYDHIEHRVVPEDEMPDLMPMDAPYQMPMDAPYQMPMQAPPSSVVPEVMPPYGAPQAPFNVSTEVIPTPVPKLRQMLSPGIDATDAPSF